MLKLAQLAARAAAALKIDIEIFGNRAAHYAPETGQAYWLTRADLQHAIDCAKSDDPVIAEDAYSHWCQSTGREMSAASLWRFYERRA